MVLGVTRRHQILRTWPSPKAPCRHKWVRGKQGGNATRIYDQWTREDNTGLVGKDIKLATARMVTRLLLKCDGTRAETRFRLSAKRTSTFKSAMASIQSTTGSRGVRISGTNAGYTMFRGSVKSTGYPLHSPVFPSFLLPCVTVCHHISTWLYIPLTHERWGRQRQAM